MNLTSRPHKSGERMRAAREKMTPRTSQIFLISSARPRTRSLRTPLPLLALTLLSLPFAERVLRACTLIYAYNVPTLRTVAQELLDRRILFLLPSLWPSFSFFLILHISRAGSISSAVRFALGPRLLACNAYARVIFSTQSVWRDSSTSNS